jgi:ornithine cyclodeaminase
VKQFSAAEVARHLPYGKLVEALREAFRTDVVTPPRHHHELPPGSTLLLMPAWTTKWTGLKTVVVKTDNAAQGLPTVQAVYLLIDNATGSTVALMDGTEITNRRTAAAAALASSYLSRPDSGRLVIMGAGALSTHFALAHAAVRPIRHISVFSRTLTKSKAVAGELRAQGLDAIAVTDLEAAVRHADIVSGVTTSTVPLLHGAWLKPGTHIDLAGAFRPMMRETDGEAVARSTVYVDTLPGATSEAGDLLQAVAEGHFAMDRIAGDLAGLCRGSLKGRHTADEITLFKSCGTALEDLAAAVLVHLHG